MFMFRGNKIVNFPNEKMFAEWFEAFDLPKMPKSLEPFKDDKIRDIENDESLTDPVPSKLKYPLFGKDTIELLKGSNPYYGLMHYSTFGGIQNINGGFDKESLKRIVRIIAMQLNGFNDELLALHTTYSEILKYAEEHKELFTSVTPLLPSTTEKKREQKSKIEVDKEGLKKTLDEIEKIKEVFHSDETAKVIDAEFREVKDTKAAFQEPVKTISNQHEVWNHVNDKHLADYFKDTSMVSNTIEKFYEYIKKESKACKETAKEIFDCLNEGKFNLIKKYSLTDDYFAIGKRTHYIFFYPKKEENEVTTGFEFFSGKDSEKNLKLFIKGLGYDVDKHKPATSEKDLSKLIDINWFKALRPDVNTSGMINYISKVMKTNNDVGNAISQWEEGEADIESRCFYGERHFVIRNKKRDNYIYFTPDGAKVYDKATLQELINIINTIENKAA